MSSYSEVQRAVRVEKLRIWFGWLCGNVILLIVALATEQVAVVSVVTQVLSVVTQVLLAVGFVALTVALFRMTGALNRKAERARREVLGDDYQ